MKAVILNNNAFCVIANNIAVCKTLTDFLYFNRNLSSAKQSNRQAMRKCRGLVDSLVSYVKDCVEADKPVDKVRCTDFYTVC